MIKIFYKKFLLFVMCFFLLCNSNKAQLVVSAGVTDAQLVAGFIGNGIVISNITRNCPSGACGTFSNGNTTNLGITKGSLFTTGSAMGAIGPDNTGSYTKDNAATFSDNDLIKIEPKAILDPCILTFNVLPSCSTLTVRFVFGSEEYPEYVNGGFNDAFGFFVTGPNPSGGSYTGLNVARLPNLVPVSINNVNAVTDSIYFVNNVGGATIQYDGFTKVITSSLNVTPCANYTFKIAIADAGDHQWDSGVFIDQLYCSSAVTASTSSKGACTACNGTATVNASNGQPPYKYLWSPGGQTTSTATGLCAGTYSVLVKDNTGCFLNSNTYTVNVPTLTAGTATISSTSNVNCKGGSNGSATAGITGGTGPFTYAWSNGNTSQTSTGLVAGNYTVVVKDINACASTKTATITEPTAVTASVSVSNIACSGNPATASAMPGGGTPGYTYLWSPGGKTTQTASGLATGTYTVLVTDSKGCTLSNMVNISITATPSVIASSTQTGCTVVKGTATATASGGPAPYTYFWSPGNQTTSVATGLSTGTYTITLTNASGCTKTNTVSVTQTSSPSVTATSTQAGCTVANGTATANPSGGTGTYTYVWLPGGKTTQTATGLTANNYTIILTDNNGCTKTNTLSITSTAPPVASVSNVLQATCGNNSGSASAGSSGGIPGYAYAWSPGGMTTQNITGLAAAVYTVTVTDMNGCTDTELANVTNANGPDVTTSVNANVLCFGELTGSATANPTGGTPAYMYLWGNGQTTQTASGLSAGTQIIKITDVNGCVAFFTAVITQPSFSLTANVPVQTNVSCKGGNTGNATANASGGTPGYSYLWSNGQTTKTATGLMKGSYTVNISDANGCTTTALVSISEPAVLTTAASSQINVFCKGGNNGEATVNPMGGTPGYTFAWNNGQSTQTATGLTAGNYSITITDAKGCTTMSSLAISEPTFALSSTSSQLNVNCKGGNNAHATLAPAGGTPGYTFLWNNGQTSQTATGLTVGTYIADITDALGCMTTTSVSITEPTLLTSTLVLTPVSCFGGNNGAAAINPSGGTPGYTYTWSNGQTNQIAMGLTTGNYTIVVSDANGCAITLFDSLSQPPVLATIASQKNSSCYGDSTGSAAVNVTGGTPNYTFMWNNGQTTASISGIIAGTYSITTTDANGCTCKNIFSITQPALLTAIASQKNIACNGGPTGMASVIVTGGTPAYTYNWNNGASTTSVSGVLAGFYRVNVMDANGCTCTNTFSITQPPVLISNPVQTSILCNGGTGTAAVNTVGGTPFYTYNWSNGQTTALVTAVAGNYSVTITDQNGCTNINSFSITQPLPLSISLSGNDSICPGETSVLKATPSGGVPSYSYGWSPGLQNGQSIAVSPVSTTTYVVSATDANGCSFLTQTFTVSVLPTPVALFDTTSSGAYSSVFSFKDLSSGGVSWEWDFGDGTTSALQNPIHRFLGTGIYNVTQLVFNQFGCADTFKLTVDLNEGIIIPNVFTPDGDGVNDVWYVANSGMAEFHVEIYDRWGLKVFETTADEIRWDGHTASGMLLTEGTYYFVLKAILKTHNGNKDYSTNGHITLLTRYRK
jgi:large repetitive protein